MGIYLPVLIGKTILIKENKFIKTRGKNEKD